jgi:thioredoxin reductase
MMEEKDLVIIGGGSAGMAAAVAAYDAGVKDLLILERGPFLGGILNQCIHNGFGLHEFNEELTGPEFLTRFVNQVDERQIPYKLNTYVSAISKDKIVTYSNSQEGYVQVKAKAIIMAAGCYERNAGAIGIPGDRPSGIITAGQAQLYMNEYGYMVGKRVFILGSGDIGLIMARRMSLEGAKVLGVAEIMPYSNGLNRNLVQCLQDYGIPLYLSHTVSKVVGKSHLERIEISQVDDKMQIIPNTVTSFDVDTLLLSIGLIPYNDLLNKAGLVPSRTRGASVNEHMETAIDGIFSCGNVLHVHDLVDNVVTEAKTAGKSAALYLQGKLIRHPEKIACEPGDGVGYIVPEEIDLANAEDNIPMKFRVRRPTKDVFIEYSLDGQVIKRIYKQTIIPSEMEIDILPKNLLINNQGKLTVSLKPREVK